MELIYFFFVLAFQFWFSLTNGLINGPGICWYNRNKSGCCQNYKEVDGSCQYIRGLIDGPGVCKDNGGNLRCCTNYQRKDTDCIQEPCTPGCIKMKKLNSDACELGTYGVNCTGGPCKYGYYGFGCSKKCHCTTDQLCDRKIGCARHLNTTNSETGRTVPIGEKMLFIVLGVFLTVGIFSTIIIVRKRMKSQGGSSYIGSMFLPQFYANPDREIRGDSNADYEAVDTRSKIEGTEKSPVCNDQGNEYLEII